LPVFYSFLKIAFLLSDFSSVLRFLSARHFYWDPYTWQGMCSIRNLGAQLSPLVLSIAVRRKKLFVQQLYVSFVWVPKDLIYYSVTFYYENFSILKVHIAVANILIDTVHSTSILTVWNIVLELLLRPVWCLYCRRSGETGETISRKRLADVCGSHRKCCDSQPAPHILLLWSEEHTT